MKNKKIYINIDFRIHKFILKKTIETFSINEIFFIRIDSL